MKLQLIDFRGSAACRYRLYSCKDAFPMFSAELRTGAVYNFISDFACGSWAAVSCIAGRGKTDSFSRAKIDDADASQKDLYFLSGAIAEIPKKHRIFKEKSAKELIAEALKKSGNNPQNSNEIREIFKISDNRFSRPLSQCSGEIFPISMALQYAAGKKIIFFPWISEFEMNRIEGCREQISHLKRNDTMVLIPSSKNDFLSSFCDGYVHFKKDGISISL